MKLTNIIKYLNLEIEVVGDVNITSINTLIKANENELSFFENNKYLKDLEKSKARAIFIKEEFLKFVPKNSIAIVTKEPYLMMARATKLFAKELVLKDGDKPAIGENSTILENVHIGLNTIIGENTTIFNGSYIGDNVTIGDNCIIYPNATIYNDTKIGNDVIIHAGVVIGSDGFGFANTQDGKYIKIYHNGNVIIGNDVEIGSNSAIDRAVFASTIIGNGVRIDNLVHIAHNCTIKDGSILAGQVGLAGSTTLNEYVVMGGQSGTAGHLEIAPFTTISARGGVTKTITTPKKYWAGFPLFEHKKWLRLQGKIAKMLN